MIHKFSVHGRHGDPSDAHLRELIDDLGSWREYYVEFAVAPTAAQLDAIGRVVSDPLLQTVEVDVPIDQHSVQVAYKRGIVDNENDSIVAACRVLGTDAVAAKVATVYRSASPDLVSVIAREACNPNIEELHRSEPHYDTLAPAGAYAPMETVDLRGLDDDELADVGRGNGRSLDLDQMRHVRAIQEATGAESVTDVLLEALDARWSDHCAHTTWTSLGKLLRRMIDAAEAAANPNVVSMFHDNAGVWDFYDGHAIALKAETHNGPSAVSAYFGQLTKIGGVLRDILGTGLGADPIGVFEYTATGRPDEPSPVAGRPAPRQIANETIRAVKEYGNTFGVPMMWSRMTFHSAYRAKPFALGGSIGLLPTSAAQRGEPRAGDLVVLIGGLTGNDGIHGASASSAGAAAMDATSVQIGSPLEEIKFREAIVDLRDGGHLRAVTDLGAAGLNSAVGEMGDPCGVWLNCALVPLKTGGLPMWRTLLSESQERMLLAVDPAHWESARRVLARHEVRATVVGTFTGDGRYCVVHAPAISEDDIVAAALAPTGPRPLGPVDEVGFDVAYDLLEWKPQPRHVAAPPETPDPVVDWAPALDGAGIGDVVAGVFTDLEVADQSAAALQYDSSVQARTHYGPLVGPGHGVETSFYVGRPLRDSRAGIVFTTGFNPWLFDVDPVRAARQAVLSAVTGQILAGVARHDVCLCDNFYTPHLAPDSDAWLVAMVDEVAALSQRLGTPFISGKDSSAGSTLTDEGMVSVPPAVFVSALGKLPDVDVARYEAMRRPGDVVALVGPRTPALAGTATARALGTADVGGVDIVDVDAAVAFYDALAATGPEISAGRVVGAGGVVATVLRMALAGGVGADLEGGLSLLAEHRCGAVVVVDPDAVAGLDSALDVRVVGTVSAESGVRVDGVEVATTEALQGWRHSFEEALR